MSKTEIDEVREWVRSQASAASKWGYVPEFRMLDRALMYIDDTTCEYSYKRELAMHEPECEKCQAIKDIHAMIPQDQMATQSRNTNLCNEDGESE